MALAEEDAENGPRPSWRRLGTPYLRQLRPHPSAAVWAVWDALCDEQGGRHDLVRGSFRKIAGATELNERTVRRALRWLEARGVIVLRTHGGGRVDDPSRRSPGKANEYDLGDGTRSFKPHGRVVRLPKNVGETTHVERGRNDPRRNVGEMTPLERGSGDPPTSSSSSGSLNPPPSTPDVGRYGPASRPSHGPIRPGVQRDQGELTPLRLSLPTLGPRTVPDPPDDVTIASLLETPIASGPDLELPPPRRRRR